jgi:hypothetical protein
MIKNIEEHIVGAQEDEILINEQLVLEDDNQQSQGRQNTITSQYTDGFDPSVHRTTGHDGSSAPIADAYSNEQSSSHQKSLLDDVNSLDKQAAERIKLFQEHQNK